jgi:chemotaxis protein histidine kinase CheA
MSQVPPELLPALAIFLDELASHLPDIRAAISEMRAELDAGSDDEQAASKHAAALEHKFHLMKGGAGFLQLSEVAQAATSGEKMFKGAKLNPQGDQPFIDQLESLVDAIDKSHKGLTSK